jgi:hypothetical protein
MKILDIGKLINSLFKQLNINIYPIVAENSAVMPFAVYFRTQTDHYHKDKSIARAYYNIEIICEQYEESINLLQRVIDMCSNIHEYNDEKVRLNIESTNEYYDDSYHQIITLTIDI